MLFFGMKNSVVIAFLLCSSSLSSPALAVFDSDEGSGLENDHVDRISVNLKNKGNERWMEATPTHETPALSINHHEDTQEVSIEEDYNGSATYSLLHGLASLNLPEFMEEVVRLGGDISNLNQHKDTPLHYAIRDCNVKSIRKLLELGANPNIQNSWGETYTNTLRKKDHCIIENSSSVKSPQVDQ